MITLAKGITIHGMFPSSHLKFQGVLVLTEILHIKSHNPITSSSITRWIVSMLDLYVINANIFSSAGLITKQIINGNKEVLYQVLL